MPDALLARLDCGARAWGEGLPLPEGSGTPHGLPCDPSEALTPSASS